MPFVVSLEQAQADYPEYKFISALTPSEQKAAFHVQDAEGADLCLKIISPNYSMDRLTREILALQAVNHPGIASFKEYTFSSRQGQQRHHIVEGFIVGDDLTAHLHAGRPWSRSRVSAFFASLCDALDVLGKKAIVHRDLKPSNIRVRANGSPVIIDLGLARHLALTDLTRTSDGAAIGTPLYFAPEQFRGTKHDIDHRTDLFAIGIMLYQALVGQHPFWKPNPTVPFGDMVCESTEHLSVSGFAALPNPWRLIAGRLLEKDRANRPKSADQVAAILRTIGGT
ncbi:MAG: serine/threonine protein kinase [Chloroflexi bacterium]|nr:serine/threonine protein kinase [Chloroflexota bacterium]